MGGERKRRATARLSGKALKAYLNGECAAFALPAVTK
jgi:hypothetical protein